jgi:hypothetical protein
MVRIGEKRRTRRKIKESPSAFKGFPGPNQCHPRIKNRPADGCLPRSVLEGSARKLGLPLTKSLLSGLAAAVGVDPTKQRSLLMKLPLSDQEKADLAQRWLRPAMPADWKEDPDMWLDSNNIRDVMKQYEEARSDFKFLGPYPIDFAARDPYVKGEDKCMIGEMCALDLDAESMKGKKYIGIVYNLDPHYKGGSHWVANFIDIPRGRCYYFDSYGMKPPKQVYAFMQWLGIQKPEICLGWNGRRFQHSNSECGMYSMYFIDRMLAGESFLKFCRRAPPDRFMLDMRDWMFST